MSSNYSSPHSCPPQSTPPSETLYVLRAAAYKLNQYADQLSARSNGAQHPALKQEPSVIFQEGLSTPAVENSFSVMLTDTLEENYLKYRDDLMGRDGLLTPYEFLKRLCGYMNLQLITECVKIPMDPNVLWRTEFYAGEYCGVAHAISSGFSKQLAAAHVLERMRQGFSWINITDYALFPGSRHTFAEKHLRSLCLKYDLGHVQIQCKDIGAFGGRFGGQRLLENGGDAQLKWECCCFVKKLQATAISDSWKFGRAQASKDMYLHLAPNVSAAQIMDYFAIGADCPKLKDINQSSLWYQPSGEKQVWMRKYGLSPFQLDDILHDPSNNSAYLMVGRNDDTPMTSKHPNVATKRKLTEFHCDLEKMSKWIQDVEHSQDIPIPEALPEDNADTPDETNAEEQEEDIFYDALMDV